MSLPNNFKLIRNDRGWQIQAFYPRASGGGIGAAKVLLGRYDGKWIIRNPWWRKNETQ